MVLAIVVFLFVFAAVGIALSLGFLFDERRRKEQLRGVLKTGGQPQVQKGKVSLVLPEIDKDAITKFFNRFNITAVLEKLLRQAQLSWTIGTLLIWTLLGSAAGFCIGAYMVGAIAPLLGGAVVGAILGSAPFLYVMRCRGKLIAAFEDQLPEALDFLSRSLRAGHGLSTGLELLASDSPEPIASSFRRVANELQLGSSLENGLGRLIDVVPLVDIRFFVSSVLLQQETGGNLSEILMKLSHIIRERFRLRGQVKAMSAHGRITGMILLLMPVAVAVILFLSSPEYLLVLTREKEGRYMLWGAVGGQVLAYFVIKKIVNIEV
jgi:tight adherence protein B